MSTQALAKKTVFVNLTQIRESGLENCQLQADFGNGIFNLWVDVGGWCLVLQAHHAAGTTPALNFIAPGNDWPLYDTRPLGTDLSGDLLRWGQINQAYAASIPDASNRLELRWYGATNDHDRRIHFSSPILGDWQSNANQNFFDQGIANPANHTLLAGHTANLPGVTTGSFNDFGNRVFNQFPLLSAAAVWSILGGPNRYEVDNVVFGPTFSTIHRVWVRVQ